MSVATSKLKTLTVFTLAAKTAVDALHNQYLGRSFPIDSDEFMTLVRRDLEKSMRPRLSGEPTEFKKGMRTLMERLLAHIYVSHQMLHLAYTGLCGTYAHSDLVREARERIDARFDRILDQAISACQPNFHSNSLRP
ncbi:MAG: hypothetical protein KC777_08885 [Cyanobacteria bacterium HKST-UBA02]|nr:hypothetical protein [Cyanobacteria bacterium HKST-UBA02]